MNCNFLKLFVCSIALCVGATLASAQVKEISHDLSSFDTIEVDYDFHVNVVKARKGFSVSMTVDDVLLDYVQCYVKSHTLYLTLDKKSLPSDIKKLYKGRNSTNPILNATVYMSDVLEAVKLAGSSVLTVEEEIECKDFDATISENAQIKKLAVDANNFTLKASGKSAADLVVYADNIKVESDGSSSVGIEQDSEILEIETKGNAELEIDGETLDVKVTSAGSSKTVLKGKTNTLSIQGSAAGFVDAINLQTADCSVKLSGSSKVYENASEALHLDMSGNSTVIFDLDPKIDIISVKSSTIQKYSSVKK